jgi:hypothetical protein
VGAMPFVLTYSHNPNENGLSCSDDNLDVKQFVKAIHAKADVAAIRKFVRSKSELSEAERTL